MSFPKVVEMQAYLNRSEDIPCRVSLCREDVDKPFVVCYGQDPTLEEKNKYGNPFIWADLDTNKIKKVLQKQRKYTKLYLNEEGDIVSQIIVERI